MEVIFGSDVEYAGFVEYGTSRMEPQPYFQPAIDEYASKIAASIKNMILRLLGRL